MKLQVIWIHFLIFSKELENHSNKAHRVIQKLMRAGFQIKMKKSKFYMKRIQFMGHLIDGFTQEIDSFKKEMAQKMVKPQTGKQVESLLGFLNFLRDFVPNYVTIAALLDKLRKMRHLGKAWGEEQDKSFDIFQRSYLECSSVVSARLGLRISYCN